MLDGLRREPPAGTRMHFAALLAGAVMLALRLAGAPLRLASMLILVMLPGYAALTGGRPAVVRASVMIGVYLLGTIASYVFL